MSSGVSNSFAFCPPLPGKPDPKQPMSNDRPRVIQRGGLSENYLSWYSAFNWIRPRHNAPNLQEHPQRKIEKIISRMRKKVIEHQGLFADSFSDSRRQAASNAKFQEMAREISHLPKAECTRILRQELPQLSLDQISQMVSVVKDLASGNNVAERGDFIRHFDIQGENEIYESILSRFGKQKDALFDGLVKNDPLFVEKWRSYSVARQRSIINHLVIGYCARLLGVEVSSWHPEQEIDSLIKELKKYGPLVVEGRFGLPLYETEPVKKGELKGKEIYGWDKNDPKMANPPLHSIVIVGARKGRAQDVVYYIDPLDDSDPAHPEKQRIYAMSYDRLIDPHHLCDRLGTSSETLGVGYAYRAGSFLNEEILSAAQFL